MTEEDTAQFRQPSHLDTVKARARHLLTCPLCNKTYSDPRVLPCGHTFCRRCLQTYIDHHVAHQQQQQQQSTTTTSTASPTVRRHRRPVGSFTCPYCSVELGLPPDGASAFPSDDRIAQIRNQMVDEMARDISRNLIGEPVERRGDGGCGGGGDRGCGADFDDEDDEFGTLGGAGFTGSTSSSFSRRRPGYSSLREPRHHRRRPNTITDFSAFFQSTAASAGAADNGRNSTTSHNTDSHSNNNGSYLSSFGGSTSGLSNTGLSNSNNTQDSNNFPSSSSSSSSPRLLQHQSRSFSTAEVQSTGSNFQRSSSFRNPYGDDRETYTPIIGRHRSSAIGGSFGAGGGGGGSLRERRRQRVALDADKLFESAGIPRNNNNNNNNNGGPAHVPDVVADAADIIPQRRHYRHDQDGGDRAPTNRQNSAEFHVADESTDLKDFIDHRQDKNTSDRLTRRHDEPENTSPPVMTNGMSSMSRDQTKTVPTNTERLKTNESGEQSTTSVPNGDVRRHNKGEKTGQDQQTDKTKTGSGAASKNDDVTRNRTGNNDGQRRPVSSHELFEIPEGYVPTKSPTAPTSPGGKKATTSVSNDNNTSTTRSKTTSAKQKSERKTPSKATSAAKADTNGNISPPTDHASSTSPPKTPQSCPSPSPSRRSFFNRLTKFRQKSSSTSSSTASSVSSSTSSPPPSSPRRPSSTTSDVAFQPDACSTATSTTPATPTAATDVSECPDVRHDYPAVNATRSARLRGARKRPQVFVGTTFTAPTCAADGQDPTVPTTNATRDRSTTRPENDSQESSTSSINVDRTNDITMTSESSADADDEIRSHQDDKIAGHNGGGDRTAPELDNDDVSSTMSASGSQPAPVRPPRHTSSRSTVTSSAVVDNNNNNNNDDDDVNAALFELDSALDDEIFTGNDVISDDKVEKRLATEDSDQSAADNDVRVTSDTTCRTSNGETVDSSLHIGESRDEPVVETVHRNITNSGDDNSHAERNDVDDTTERQPTNTTIPNGSVDNDDDDVTEMASPPPSPPSTDSRTRTRLSTSTINDVTGDSSTSGFVTATGVTSFDGKSLVVADYGADSLCLVDDIATTTRTPLCPQHRVTGLKPFSVEFYSGRLYVGDRRRKTVSIFDSDLCDVAQWPDNQFDWVCGIAAFDGCTNADDDDGGGGGSGGCLVAVIDRSRARHQLVVYTPDGRGPVVEMGPHGTGDHELCMAEFVAADRRRRRLLVSDSANHCVKAFDPRAGGAGPQSFAGRLGLDRDGVSEIRWPKGLVLDERSSTLYVTDSRNGRILAVDANDGRARGVVVDGLRSPYSVGLFGNGQLAVTSITLSGRSEVVVCDVNSNI